MHTVHVRPRVLRPVKQGIHRLGLLTGLCQMRGLQNDCQMLQELPASHPTGGASRFRMPHRRTTVSWCGGQEFTGVCQEAAAVQMQAVALLTSPLADLTRLMGWWGHPYSQGSAAS